MNDETSLDYENTRRPRSGELENKNPLAKMKTEIGLPFKTSGRVHENWQND
jgi:hypothetical protein